MKMTTSLKVLLEPVQASFGDSIQRRNREPVIPVVGFGVPKPPFRSVTNAQCW